MKKEEVNKIEIRSEEVQEILGKPPRWIIRAGIGIVLVVVLTIFIGSWFFKYPDIIQANITVTTINPPVPLVAKTTGKITKLFVRENQSVEKNTTIAIIENTANYHDIILLNHILDTLTKIELFPDTLRLNLGEIQSGFASFSRLLSDYHAFKKMDYYHQKIQSIEQQIKDNKKYLHRLTVQQKILQKEYLISLQQFQRDTSLFNKKVLSKVDMEKSEKALLQQKYSYEGIKTTIASTQTQLNQLFQQILDLKLQNRKEEQQQEIALEEAFQNLKSQIAQWQQTYLIISPISGKVSFNEIWSQNQTVQTGETVATVIPIGKTDIIGKIQIPATGAGKVKVGQKVNIKFNNFPHMEFGLIRGKIKNISLVPVVTKENGAIYTAEVELPKDLVTNYGKKLKFSQEMTGTAEIITDDVRLLERFLNPIKSLLKKNT